MKKAFTLIELLIVIIIIGILAALAMPQYTRIAEQSRQAEGVRLLGSIRTAQERYYARFNEYTLIDGGLDIEIPAPRYFAGSRGGSYTNDAADTCGFGSRIIGGVTRNAVHLPAGYNYALVLFENGNITYPDCLTNASAIRPGL